MPPERFQDENKRLKEFQTEVAVHCPQCDNKALAAVNYEQKTARLFCIHCGFNKDRETLLFAFGMYGHFEAAAHSYFGAKLWYKSPFKNDVFWAYNEQHLEYLERYISAKLRQSKDRTHFTLLEKLPRFYHDAKNRKALLKIIEKLRKLPTGN